MKRLILCLLCLAAALLCAACSSTDGVTGHTKGYDTPENLRLFQESPLFTLAQGFYNSASKYPAAVYGEDDMNDPYFFTRRSMAVSPMPPYLAVSVRMDDNKQPVWKVIGGSAEKMDLENVRTVAVCIVTKRTAEYKRTGYSDSPNTFRGSTEDARILYLDTAAGKYVTETELKGKALPDRTSGTPHYTLSDSELVNQVMQDLTLPYTLTADGEITGGKLNKNYEFPPDVKKITKLELDPNVTALTLPASLTEIAEGVLPRSVSERSRSHAVVLTVERDSYGERFAREGGYIYRYPEKDTEYLWISGCECIYKSEGWNYPLQPDGEFAVFMPKHMLVLDKGSQAEEYARAHQYLYSYSDDDEKHFCVNGLDWVDADDDLRYIVVPDGFSADARLISWLKSKSHLLVSPGSLAEKTCRDAGLNCWVGDESRAERTWQSEDGLTWRAAVNFKGKGARRATKHIADGASLLEAHIPAEYRQNNTWLDTNRLKKDMGLGGISQYGDETVYYAWPGSWAAEVIKDWIDETAQIP